MNYGHDIKSLDAWRQQFNTAPQELFDMATSLFHDSYDDALVAAELSAHFRFTVSPEDVRQIRLSACVAAWDYDDPPSGANGLSVSAA